MSKDMKFDKAYSVRGGLKKFWIMKKGKYYESDY